MEVLPGSDQIVQVAFEREKNEPSVPFDFVEGKVVFQVVDKGRLRLRHSRRSEIV